MSPYYGTGTKEGILANLETVLNTISGIKFVDYQRTQCSGASADKYPGIYINDIGADKQRLLKDLVRNGPFGVSLFCFVWATTEEDLITKLDAFVETVKAKIMLDPYRDENAYDTIIENTRTDGGSRHPQGLAIINLAIPFYGED